VPVGVCSGVGIDSLKYVLERRQPAMRADGDYMCL
jgi:hypothetical protein